MGAWDKASSFAQEMAFAVEFVTFALYFHEESFVLFLRGYSLHIYNNDSIRVYLDNVLNFDFMFAWFVGFFNSFGILAVYSYNAYASYLYMLAMWREYSNIQLGYGPLNYSFKHMFIYEGFEDPEW